MMRGGGTPENMSIAIATRKPMTTQLTTHDGVACPAPLKSPVTRRTCRAISCNSREVNGSCRVEKLSGLLL